MTVTAADGRQTKDEPDHTKTLLIIYSLVVLYAVCYQLQSPLEPFLVDKLVGKDKSSEGAAAYGQLQSFFMVIQAIGSLGFGTLLDRYGARVGFLVNFIACAASYTLLANTDSMTMLFLSKVPGVGMAGFLCAQTSVSQVTYPGPERIKALGRLTTAYTIGGTVGPYLGGWLGLQGDYLFSAKIAAVGSLFAAVLSCFLPGGRVAHTKVDAKEGKTDKDDADAKPTSTQNSWLKNAILVWELVGSLILVKLATSTANSMASSTQSQVLKNQLNFSEADLGLFLSCEFAFGGFANGFLLGPVTALLGGKSESVVKNCILCMALGYSGLALLQAEMLGLVVTAAPALAQTYSFVGITMILSIFRYSLSTSITAESTHIVPENLKGTLMGIEHSTFAAARIATPTIGIKILTMGGPGVLYACCSSVFFVVGSLWVLLAGRFLRRPKSS